MVIDKKYSHIKADNTHCWYCKREYATSVCLFERPKAPLQRTVDHIFPKGGGGRNSHLNKIGCCSDCNKLKGGKTLDEFISYLSAETKGHQMSKLFPIIIQRCWKLKNKFRAERVVHHVNVIKGRKKRGFHYLNRAK